MPVWLALRRGTRRHLPEDGERETRKTASQVSIDKRIPEERLRGTARLAVEKEPGGAGVSKGEVFGDEEGGDEEVVAETRSEHTRVYALEEFVGEAASGDRLGK